MESQKIHEDLFSRSVEEFVDPEGKFREKLRKKSDGVYEGELIIKFGVDPTRPDIHLGHAVIFRRLRQLQDLGCKVVFLVGDFTVQIGDPTGKNQMRPEISQEEADKNVKSYLEQVGRILNTDPNVFSWIRNSDWYYGVTDLEAKEGIRVWLENRLISPRSFAGKAILYENTRMQKTHLGRNGIHDVTLRGLLFTLRHITHGRLIQRDMFQDRLKHSGELFMHEMLYPVLQGIDSYLIHLIYGSCDLEVGGSDQTFNMLMGRDVMKTNGVAQQAVLSFKLLEGLDGKQKMSKSLDNYVGITDAPDNMYGKIMSIPDASIGKWFELCTYTPMKDIKKFIQSMTHADSSVNSAVNPKNIKMRLAREIVSIYHGEEKAKSAEEEFTSIFQKGELPEEMPVLKISAFENVSITDILETAFTKGGEKRSKSDIRRLIEQGAVIYQGKKIADPHERLHPVAGDIVKVGKKTWFKIGV